MKFEVKKPRHMTQLLPHRRRRRGQRGQLPPKIREKCFSGKKHVKFWHFVNSSRTYFLSKMSCPQSWLSSYAYASPWKPVGVLNVYMCPQQHWANPPSLGHSYRCDIERSTGSLCHVNCEVMGETFSEIMMRELRSLASHCLYNWHPR